VLRNFHTKFTNTIIWWKEISFKLLIVSTNWLWNVKKQQKKKVSKNTYEAESPSTKVLFNTHNFLDWYEISTTKTRVVYATFPKERDIVWRRNKLPKFIVIQKMFGFWTLNYSYNNQTSSGIIPNFFIIKNKYWRRRYKPPKLQSSKCSWEIQIDPVNFEWLPK